MLLTGQSSHTSLLGLSRAAAHGMTSSTIKQSKASGSIAVRSSCPVRSLTSSQSRRRTSQPRQSRAIPRNAADRSSGTSSSINWHGPSSSKPTSRHKLREYPAIHHQRASALYIEQLPSRGVGSSVELASLGYPFLPLQLQPLVSSFYYWNILMYSRTNRLIGIPIRLRSLNLRSGIDVVIVSPPRCGVNHMVRWESGT
jgi:hypothetical protein